MRLHKNACLTLCAVVALIATMSSLDAAAADKDNGKDQPNQAVVVFDASGSMCGYLVSSENDGPIQRVLKRSSDLKEGGAAVNNYLLVQLKNENAPLGSRDIVRAHPNYYSALASVSRHKPKGCVVPDAAMCPLGESKPGCRLTPGNFSPLDLIFDSSGPTANAKTIILVSDLLFDDAQRERFSQKFMEWMQRSKANLRDMNAGFAIVQSKFAGTYFPAVDQDAKQTGYAVPEHNRPVGLVWISTQPQHARLIADLVDRFAPAERLSNGTAAVQRLLPFHAQLQRVDEVSAQIPESLSEILGNSDRPQIRFQSFDKDRGQAVLQECIDVRISDEKLLVIGREKCKDNRPLFDGVTKVTIVFQQKRSAHWATDFRVKSANGQVLSRSDPAASSVVIDLTNKSLGDGVVEISVSVPTAIAGLEKIKAWSMDSDDCRVKQGSARSKSAWAEECAKNIDAKTFRLDTFVGSMASRAKLVTGEELRKISTRKFGFNFQIKGGA